MSTPATFVVNGIQSLLYTQSLTQRFIYPDTEPYDTLSLDNQFVPTPTVDSITNFESRNAALSGYRWAHTTSDSDTYGDYFLQRFVSGSPVGTSLIGFSQTFDNFKVLIDASFTQPVEFLSDVTISGTTTFDNPVVINGGMSLNSTVSILTSQQIFDFGTTVDSSIFLIKNNYSTPSSGYQNSVVIGAGAPLGPGFAFTYSIGPSSGYPGEFHLYPLNSTAVGTPAFNVAYDISSNCIFEFPSNVRIGTNTQTVSTNSRFEVNSTLAYNTLHSGTQTAQTGNNQICNYINPTLAPSAQITGYVAGNVITPTITVPNVSNPAITAGYGQFINLSINGTAGKTLTSSYGLLIGAGSLSTASVTNAYGGYFSNPAFGSGVKMALYADNMSVGYQTTPLTNGMWIAGSVGIGTNGDIGARLVSQASGSFPYNTVFGGTQTGQNLNRQIAVGIFSVLAPSAQITGDVTGLSTEPTITVPNVTNPAIASGYGHFINLTINGTAGKTLTNSYGMFVGAGSLSTASVTNSYSGYFTNPGFGTNKTALYADNLSIGVTGSTPPSNGMLISGSINSSSTTDSTSASTGAFFTSGGIGIAKSLFCTGNGTFSFANATAGTLLVQNTNNSSGSSATVNIKVGGSSADDAVALFTVTGTSNWIMGIDNTNATTGLDDAFTLSQSTSFGTNDVFIISKNPSNIGLWGYSDGGGQKVIFIANKSIVPSSNPTGGGILYVDAGALKYRGSAGTVTTIANA